MPFIDVILRSNNGNAEHVNVVKYSIAVSQHLCNLAPHRVAEGEIIEIIVSTIYSGPCSLNSRLKVNTKSCSSTQRSCAENPSETVGFQVMIIYSVGSTCIYRSSQRSTGFYITYKY